MLLAGGSCASFAMAAFVHWDDVLPRIVQAHVKHRGHCVAVPVSIHRANWLWSNADVLRRAGVTTIPATLDEFFAALERVRAAGLVPIAAAAAGATPASKRK